MGWAKKNVSELQLKSIAESLFTVTERSGNWLNGLCPIHGDRNQSFGYNFTEDVFHCHTQCTKDGDLIDLFCLVEGFDQQKGFVEFKKRFCDGAEMPPQKQAVESGPGKKEDEVLPPVDLEQMRAAYDSFPPLPESWIKRLEVMRGWSATAISEVGIKLQTYYRCKYSGELKPVREGLGRIVIPVRDHDDVIQNLRLYDPAATGKNKLISWGRGIGQNRLFPFPAKGVSRVVWICEGESDMLCARSMGLEAYTQTAKRMKWPADQVKAFKDLDVVICYDADKPGRKYADGAAESLMGIAASIRVINWPDYMLEDGELALKRGQDLTDFAVAHGKGRADLEALLPLAKAVDVIEDVREDAFWEFWGVAATGREAFQARLLADRLLRDNDLAFDPETELLYKYNGNSYIRFQPASLKRQAILYLGVEAKSERYSDAVNQAISLATIPDHRNMDDRPEWICLLNGMFNITTFDLVPHDRDFLSSVQIDINFDPDKPPDPPKRWLQFLSETIQTEGPIMQLQEFYGYCLTRETRYETCLFTIGDGGDGKSTAQRVLRALCGRQNCTAVSFDGLEDQFQRSSLYNKLVNMSSEVGGKAMDSEFFKRIISGDEISAAFKHKNAFDFEPFCKLVFAVNKMPKILDNTDGLYRRLLIIYFKQQFLPGDPNRDPHLEAKLLAELPGIFGWALAGLVRLRERGCFDVNHEETLRMVSDYRRQNSPIFAFAQDQLLVGKEYRAEKTNLYKTYKSYCSLNGYGAVHRENFFADLRRAIKGLKNTKPTVDGKRIPHLEGVGLVTVQGGE